MEGVGLALSTVRPQRVLIAVQPARQVHRYSAASGSQSVTSLSALERLEQAETAISAEGSSRSPAYSFRSFAIQFEAPTGGERHS